MPRLVLAVMSTALLMLLPSSASARDYAETARNIVPSGQWGEAPVPPGADSQAKMYDSLTPKFDQVTAADLNTSFKSEGFGVGPDGPAKSERVPRRGVKIVRDRYNVPHITGRTRDDVTWAMGWILQEDRGLLLAQARYAGAPRRRRRAQHQRVRPRHRAEDLQAHAPRRSHDPPQRPARAALRRPRRQGAQARHRRLRRRHQRAAARGEEQGQEVHPRRPVRLQRARRPDLRPGRRRRGPARPVLRRAARAPRQQRGEDAVRRPLRAVGRRHPDDPHAQGPLRPRPAEAERQRDPRRRQPAADAHRGRERAPRARTSGPATS